MSKVKMVFVTIIDGTQTDNQMLARFLKKHSTAYEFIIAPKEIKLRNVDDIIEELEKLKNES